MSDIDSLDYDSDEKDKQDLVSRDPEGMSDGEEDAFNASGADDPALPELQLPGVDTMADAGSAQAIFEESGGLEGDIDLSEDEYDPGEDGFQKFDAESRQDYIESFHPEASHMNYDEIDALCTVVRDSDGNVVDALHLTNPWLTKYEYTRVLGQRTKQLNSGVRPAVQVPPNIVDNSVIAKMELAEKKIPFIIRRPLPGGGTEFWRLKDLEIVSH